MSIKKNTDAHLFPSRRSALRLLTAGCVVVATRTALALEGRFELTLLIDEPETVIHDGKTAVIANPALQHFSVRVVPQFGHVRYGSLRVFLDHESVDTMMTVKGEGEGYRCDVELKETHRVHLHPGENLIDVRFLDTWNQPHEGKFTLVIVNPKSL